jgi:hypothetical protein
MIPQTLKTRKGEQQMEPALLGLNEPTEPFLSWQARLAMPVGFVCLC